MSNNITIELCAEDRARLDRLAEALERKTCDGCVRQIADVLKDLVQKPTTAESTEPKADTPVEAPKNTVEEAEAETAQTADPVAETPTEKTDATAPTLPMIDRAELRAKVVELSAKGLKEQVRDIVRAYAQTVTAIPEDKVSECYAKLVKLEG